MTDKVNTQNGSPQDLIDALRGAQADLAAGYEAAVQARDETEKNKALYEEIFSGSKEAIFMVDKETAEIVGANQRACEMLGYSHDELTSLKQPDLYPKASRNMMKQEFRHSVESGGGFGPPVKNGKQGRSRGSR